LKSPEGFASQDVLTKKHLEVTTKKPKKTFCLGCPNPSLFTLLLAHLFGLNLPDMFLGGAVAVQLCSEKVGKRQLSFKYYLLSPPKDYQIHF